MCDIPAGPAWAGWRGWLPLPVPKRVKPLGDWVDLTYPLSPNVPRGGLFPTPKFTWVAEMPTHPFNVTHVEMVVHMGTHVDAPRHFFLDAPPWKRSHWSDSWAAASSCGSTSPPLA